MKQKKLLTLFLTVATSFSMLVACSNATFAESTGTATVTESTNTTDKKQKADENQDAAKQLLVDLTGSYQELWPVILDEKYQQIWIDDPVIQRKHTFHDPFGGRSRLLQIFCPMGMLWHSSAIAVCRDLSVIFFQNNRISQIINIITDRQHKLVCHISLLYQLQHQKICHLLHNKPRFAAWIRAFQHLS